VLKNRGIAGQARNYRAGEGIAEDPESSSGRLSASQE